MLMEKDPVILRHWYVRAGYSRVQVPLERLEVLEGACSSKLHQNAVIWVYIADDLVYPTKEFPIIQSYVDGTH